MSENEQKAYIQLLVEKWKPRLALQHWLILVEINPDLNAEDEDCEADIAQDVKYHEAGMTIYKPFWQASHDESHREINIVHELCHLVAGRLHPHIAPTGDDALEEIVQSFAMTLMAAYK